MGPKIGSELQVWWHRCARKWETQNEEKLANADFLKILNPKAKRCGFGSGGGQDCQNYGASSEKGTLDSVGNHSKWSARSSNLTSRRLHAPSTREEPAFQ